MKKVIIEGIFYGLIIAVTIWAIGQNARHIMDLEAQVQTHQQALQEYGVAIQYLLQRN